MHAPPGGDQRLQRSRRANACCCCCCCCCRRLRRLVSPPLYPPSPPCRQGDRRAGSVLQPLVHTGVQPASEGRRGDTGRLSSLRHWAAACGHRRHACDLCDCDHRMTPACTCGLTTTVCLAACCREQRARRSALLTRRWRQQRRRQAAVVRPRWCGAWLRPRAPLPPRSSPKRRREPRQRPAGQAAPALGLAACWPSASRLLTYPTKRVAHGHHAKEPGWPV